MAVRGRSTPGSSLKWSEYLRLPGLRTLDQSRPEKQSAAMNRSAENGRLRLTDKMYELGEIHFGGVGY